MPKQFIHEPITVEFDEPPTLEKAPPCPDRFIWREETLTVSASLAEWVDFERRGRAARNMRPEHAARAAVTGSWGVGRYHFQVQVADGRIFELYYDRAPKNADQGKGQWILSTMQPADETSSADSSTPEEGA